MRFGSTAKVLLKCKLKYYRISECILLRRTCLVELQARKAIPLGVQFTCCRPLVDECDALSFTKVPGSGVCMTASLELCSQECGQGAQDMHSIDAGTSRRKSRASTGSPTGAPAMSGAGAQPSAALSVRLPPPALSILMTWASRKLCPSANLQGNMDNLSSAPRRWVWATTC